jgi:LCP family protein required for cell wall assembly
MFSARLVRVVAGKVGYTLSCLLAAVLLVVSGYAHKVVSQVSALEKGYALNGGEVGSTTAPFNILVMGLESRTNFYGQELPAPLLVALHAGSTGGEDPDTLILIHIYDNGRKAIGFSIPRDDLVTYPQTYVVDIPLADGGGSVDIPSGKIDDAYDWAYNESLDKTGSATHADYDLANQMGQAAEIKIVESITGVTISHFIETNLAGFYYLAQAFGGVEVCLKPQEAGINSSNYENSNLYDYNSGFNAVKYDGYNLARGGAQYLDLQPDQALAFVRERDNLAEGDIDRTRRQQAVLDYVVYELKHENAFSDFGKLNTLLAAANQYILTDPKLNLLDFATQMQALSGQNVSFQTLPSDPNVPEQLLPGWGDTPQAVNTIDVPYLKRLVQTAFNPQPAARAKAKSAPKKKAAPVPPASTVTVDVYNGGSTGGLAANVQQALVSLGYKAGPVGNAPATPAVTAGTQVFYGAGASANAAKIATDFGATARALASLPAQHVEVLLGTGSTVVPAGLAPSASASAATPSASAVSAPPAGTESGGGTLTVGPQAKYGIPCVY